MTDPKKIDVEEIVKSFRVTNIEAFSSYLKEIWMDLYQRNKDQAKGLAKLTFCSYYKLPGMISDRLFSVLDKKNQGFIDMDSFIQGMKTLFCDDFDKSSKFIFDFYDYDNDGIISKSDVQTVLSYITLTPGLATSTEANAYLARVRSQEELKSVLDKSFTGYESDKINYKEFLDIVENVASDIYIFILMFLLDKRPFSKFGLNEYEKQTNKPGCKTPRRENKSKYVASPSVVSNANFSPSVLFMREVKKRKAIGLQLDDIETEEGSGGGSHSTRNTTKRFTLRSGEQGLTHSTFFQGNQKTPTSTSSFKKEKAEVNPSREGSPARIPVYRKTKTNLKNIQHEPQSHKTEKKQKNYDDVEIVAAYKTNSINTTPSSFKESKNEQEESKGKKGKGYIYQSELQLAADAEKPDIEIEDFTPYDQEDETNLVFQGSDDEGGEEDVIKYEGYLYKLIENVKLKKLWFKLIHKDLYFFKNDQDKSHKGMHNLSGVFLREEKPINFNKQLYYCFSIIYPKKERFYYVDNESQYKIWISKLKQATEFTNLTDIYDVTKKLGNGKFGLVKLGVNKLTKKKVAIKIMAKKDMEQDDLELVRTEIEILKICQHPNIIALYDVFENVDYYYIIMEFCDGGDLFSYLEKRHFKLSEERARKIICKLCSAINYIHSYSIVHRDIKPENVLMTSSEDDADIRLLDFGLGKILGPGEYCTEPYGTLSYVAPEVLLEQPYNKSVDMWSLGVTSYLLLCGSLPFDHPTDDKEIARQTINDPVPFKGTIWKTINSDAIDFVTKLLIKDPLKRMTIKEACEHKWITGAGNSRPRGGSQRSSSSFKTKSSVQ